MLKHDFKAINITYKLHIVTYNNIVGFTSCLYISKIYDCFYFSNILCKYSRYYKTHNCSLLSSSLLLYNENRITCFGGSNNKSKRGSKFVLSTILSKYALNHTLTSDCNNSNEEIQYIFKKHIKKEETFAYNLKDYIICKQPCSEILQGFTYEVLKNIALLHEMKVLAKSTADYVRNLFSTHSCKTCEDYVLLFQKKNKLPRNTLTSNKQDIPSVIEKDKNLIQLHSFSDLTACSC